MWAMITLSTTWRTINGVMDPTAMLTTEPANAAITREGCRMQYANSRLIQPRSRSAWVSGRPVG